VKHDNTVTWLAFWNDPINPKEFKYVFLAASSSLKGQSDKEKYEKARKLKVLIYELTVVVTCDMIEELVFSFCILSAGLYTQHQNSLHKGFCK
jgi:DNA topoisomerase-1